MRSRLASVTSKTGVAHRLETGAEAVLDKQIEFARLFGGQILNIKILNRPTKTSGVSGKVHMLKQTDATAPGQMPCQLLGTSLPNGDSMPIPVTTTRLRDTAISFSSFQIV